MLDPRDRSVFHHRRSDDGRDRDKAVGRAALLLLDPPGLDLTVEDLRRRREAGGANRPDRCNPLFSLSIGHKRALSQDRSRMRCRLSGFGGSRTVGERHRGRENWTGTPIEVAVLQPRSVPFHFRAAPITRPSATGLCRSSIATNLRLWSISSATPAASASPQCDSHDRNKTLSGARIVSVQRDNLCRLFGICALQRPIDPEGGHRQHHPDRRTTGDWLCGEGSHFRSIAAAQPDASSPRPPGSADPTSAEQLAACLDQRWQNRLRRARLRRQDVRRRQDFLPFQKPGRARCSFPTIRSM